MGTHGRPFEARPVVGPTPDVLRDAPCGLLHAADPGRRLVVRPRSSSRRNVPLGVHPPCVLLLVVAAVPIMVWAIRERAIARSDALATWDDRRRHAGSPDHDGQVAAPVTHARSSWTDRSQPASNRPTERASVESLSVWWPGLNAALAVVSLVASLVVSGATALGPTPVGRDVPRPRHPPSLESPASHGPARPVEVVHAASASAATSSSTIELVGELTGRLSSSSNVMRAVPGLRHAPPRHRRPRPS